MKTIEVDEELYRYIASHTQHIGESASDILRRMLNFKSGTQHSTEQIPHQPDTPVSITKTELVAVKYGGLYLEQQLTSEEMQSLKKAVDRFIFLLSILYSINPQQFASVAKSLCGRTRVYFAHDEKTLLKHGNKTKPKAISNTPYWVITNTNSERKRTMIVHIMKSMQFSEELITKACQVI